MKKILLFLILSVFIISGTLLTSIPSAKALDIQDSKNYFDWTSYLNTTQHEGKIFEGPYYKEGIMGKRDIVEFGNETYVEFKLVNTYMPFKFKNQLISMEEEIGNTLQVTNEIGTTVSTTVGISSLIELGLNFENLANASVNQSMTVENTLSETKVYTESAMTTSTWKFKYDLSVIPNDKIEIGYGKIAVYLKYFIKQSYRRIYWLWDEGPENNTMKSNYYAYKFLFEIDSYIYKDNTFGDTKSGLYRYSSEQCVKSE